MTDDELAPDEREAVDLMRNRPAPFVPEEDRAAWEAFLAGWTAAGRWRPELRDSPDVRMRAFRQWKDAHGDL